MLIPRWNVLSRVGSGLLLAVFGLLLAGAPPVDAQGTECLALPGALQVTVIAVDQDDPLVLQATGGGTFSETYEIRVECTASPAGARLVPNSAVRVCVNLNAAGVPASAQASLLIDGEGGSVAINTSGCDLNLLSGEVTGTTALVETGADGKALVTITTTDPVPPGSLAPIVLVGQEEIILTQAFGVSFQTGTTPGGNPVFAGADQDDALIFAENITPELDSFVLFGVGALALAGYTWRRRRSVCQN